MKKKVKICSFINFLTEITEKKGQISPMGK